MGSWRCLGWLGRARRPRKKCKKLQIYTKYRRGGSKQSSDLKKYEEYIVGNHPHEAMLGTTLIRPGLQSKLSSLRVCNSKNGMGFGPSWALLRPCWETILEPSWGPLGPSWDYLVVFLGLSWQPSSSDQDSRANCQV